MERIVVDCQTGAIETVGLTPEEIAALPQSTPPAYTKVFKADIWRRASDNEAAAIDALLKLQSPKLQRLWDDVAFLETTDPLFSLVHAGAVQLFGSARAEELLQPTE